MTDVVALTAEQTRLLDRLAIEEYGIPGVVLMENAGRSFCEVLFHLRRELDWAPSRDPVAILCGGGNNGGDGYVIARHLYIAGAQVAVFSAVDPKTLSGDAAINRKIVDKMGLHQRTIGNGVELAAASDDLKHCSIVVDALLGTGFKGEVRPHMAAVIETCNALKPAKIVAVDVPSGLDCDSGKPSNATVRADVTVTFVAIKKGFLSAKAKPFLGRIAIGGIGTPPELLKAVTK